MGPLSIRTSCFAATGVTLVTLVRNFSQTAESLGVVNSGRFPATLTLLKNKKQKWAA